MANRLFPTDLKALPQIKSWPDDGGAFITLPLVYTESPISGKGNLGMYRVQLYEAAQGGMHIQIHRGGGYHYHEAEKLHQALPVRIFIGGPPALTLAAIAPLPEDIPELLFASLLMGRKLWVGDPDNHGLPMLLEADFSIQGSLPPFLRRAEGPFGDHYGYYSLRHEYPYFNADSIQYRNGAIYPATVVGRPPQEDHYIAEFLQELLAPLFPLVMPNVRQVWAYEESGVHSLAAAIVRNRYPREAFSAGLRILSEGQLSLTKCLWLTDQNCDLKDFKKVLQIVLERIDFSTDMQVLANSAQDTLDYTGPAVNQGSKVFLIGVGDKRRELKSTWQGRFESSDFGQAMLFCPGVLCVQGTAYARKQNLAADLLQEPAIRDMTLVVLVDDAQMTCRSTSDFIWHVFTRFEPAADIHGDKKIDGFRIGLQGPVVVDSRMKPWYPPALTEAPEIVHRVQEKWGATIDRVCRGRQPG